MQLRVGAASTGIRTGRLTDFGGAERGRALRFRLQPNWLGSGALGLVYLVSVASLAGFATFGIHPELLQRSGVSAETYARILVVAPRAQIVIAMAALVALLVRRAGARWIVSFLVVYLVSLGAELAGTTVGLPFGPYRYTDGLGIKWFGHVPALIPVSWFMMALPSYAIASRRFPRASQVPSRLALGSFILLSWDFALDPAMSFATKYWVWGTTGPYYGMPILNLVGWFVTGVALMVTFALLRVDRWVDGVPTSWLLGFYGANLLLPVGMSVAAGLWGVVVATGVALALAALIARTARAREGVA
jgi:putative membrane protein